MIERYPLDWPLHQPRTPATKRQRAQFHKTKYNGNWNEKQKLSVSDGVKRIENELDSYTRVGHEYRIPQESIIISTNVPPGKKGRPMSGLAEPEDPGVAVYFTLDGLKYCYPCDKWDRVADNLAAVAAHILALRKIENWGVGQTHDVYTGFKALPEQAGVSNGAWWDILGVNINSDSAQIKEAYQKKARYYHPDNKVTGDVEKFNIITKAYKEATAK